MGIFERLFGNWRWLSQGGLRRAPVAPRVIARQDRSQRAEPVVSSGRPRPVAAMAPVPRTHAPTDSFTPTRPKAGRRQLVGRDEELARIVQAIAEEQAHVVLYSERGRGKTSLANLVTEALRRQGRIVARYTCEASSSFDTIVRGLARDLPASLLAVPDERTDSEGCETALPDQPLRPRDVAALPARLNCRELVCVIDEFDRIEDEQTRTRFADTIKQVSDRGVGLSLMIVGVSENLEQILGQHPSIQRNIVTVHLPLLSDAEIGSMLTKGSRDSGFSFAPDVVAGVTLVARGMPYMAQLLGLRIAQSALARGGETATQDDLAVAVKRLLADARQHVVANYARLTDGGANQVIAAALWRLATAEQDRWGYFTLTESADGVVIGGRTIAAPLWSRLSAEAVLRQAPGQPGLVAFTDRGLMHHVLLLAAERRSQPANADLPEPMAGVSYPDAMTGPRARRPLVASGR